MRWCFRFLYALLAVTVGAFAGAIALIGVSFYWFNPAGVGDCSFNVFVITLTILLTVGVSLGSLHPQVECLQHCRTPVLCAYDQCSYMPVALMGRITFPGCWPLLCLHMLTVVAKFLLFSPWALPCQMHVLSLSPPVTHPKLWCMQAQNGSLFPSAVVTLYCSYLCYSSLQSEPHDYECNGLGKHFTAASGSTLAVGMVIAIVSVVYSALRAGSNNRTFMSSREAAVEEGLLEKDAEGTSAGLDGEPQGQTMGKLPHTQPCKCLNETCVAFQCLFLRLFSKH